MDERLKNIVDNFDKMKIGADETFRFHCTMCGKCCIEREDILLNPKDVYRMSKALGITPRQLAEQYGDVYIGHDSRIPIIRLKPRGSIRRCPLLKDHKCMVHNAKPTVCAMYPIGRAVMKKSEDNHITADDVQFIFTNPDCGDRSETHTVREWLEGFGIPVADEYFAKWQQIILDVGLLLRKAEKVVEESAMPLLWGATFDRLYMHYDTEKEFLPQMEENAERILAALRNILDKKGGDPHE